LQFCTIPKGNNMTVSESLVWELLHAALYDLTVGKKEDGIAAIEDAIFVLDAIGAQSEEQHTTS
jgi:hypothetical protein